MNDDTFLTAFEACTLPNHAFRHREHVRLAWLYVRRDGAVEGEDAVVLGIQRFAAAYGATGLYNDTLTRFWVRLIAHHIDLAPSIVGFDEFIARFAPLLDTGLTYRHYSRHVLAGESARRQWVEPDVRPFPWAS